MAARFRVKVNGELLCTPGLSNGIELAALVRFTNFVGSRPTCLLEIHGSGETNNETHQMPGATWPGAELHSGDIVEIALLTGGEFDLPLESNIDALPPIDDPAFGTMHSVLEGWECSIPFLHGPFTDAHVVVYSDDGAPTTAQRALYAELIDQFDVLWPEINETLKRCHKRINTNDAINTEIEPRIAIDLATDASEIVCRFQFRMDQHYQMYSAILRDWVIVEFTSN